MRLVYRIYIALVKYFVFCAMLTGLIVFLTFLPIHYSASAIHRDTAPSGAAIVSAPDPSRNVCVSQKAETGPAAEMNEKQER